MRIRPVTIVIFSKRNGVVREDTKKAWFQARRSRRKYSPAMTYIQSKNLEEFKSREEIYEYTVLKEQLKKFADEFAASLRKPYGFTKPPSKLLTSGKVRIG